MSGTKPQTPKQPHQTSHQKSQEKSHRRELTQEIPEHLAVFIVQQRPELYTAIDHASWRFILKVSQAYFAKHAHRKYLDGLRETGISTERIPLISEMDACLRNFNWRAVAVSGFIPPAVFMEFFSLGVLPIACDMRKLDNLAYTPAPDIVHEAAGHAPIIADPEYAEYLRLYGEISRKAIYSDQDMEVYYGIRHLSEVKEDPASKPGQISAAQKRLDGAVAAVDHLSEATLLARMNWWTVEYGLVGDLNDPKIYGAGLLSSMRESYHCLEPSVKKIPLTVDCVNTPYDITRPQPQLFVARDFHQLTEVLEEFAETMAYRVGGRAALAKASRARTVTTTELESGIQISGKLDSWIEDGSGTPIYLKYAGPVQLAHEGTEIEGQGAGYHAQGFSTALGRLKGRGVSPAEFTDQDIAALSGGSDGRTRLEFESGVVVEGRFKGSVRRGEKTVILAFEDCTVSRGGDILFRPEWGTYDLACGERVVSVCGGPADYPAYQRAIGEERRPMPIQKTNLTPGNRELNLLYARIRELRDRHSTSGATTEGLVPHLAEVLHELDARYKQDWLSRYEILEILAQFGLDAPWAPGLRAKLEARAQESDAEAEIIGRGLALLPGA